MPGFPWLLGRHVEVGQTGQRERRAGYGGKTRECTGPDMEATVYRTTPRRAAIAAGAVLLTLTSTTAEPTTASTRPTAAASVAEPAPTPDFAVLATRAELAANPRASRRTAEARRPARAARTESRKPRSRPAASRSTIGRDTPAGDRRYRESARRGADAVLAFARQQIGDPYRRGAAGPGAWDCSGLTMKAYARAGVSLPHKAARQGSMGRSVARGAARPGDLVVWGTYHVGIYVGDGKVLHSPRPGKAVQVARIWGSPRFRRLL